MKQLLVLFAFISLGCNAQTPVLSLYEDQIGNVNGAYYADDSNDLDNYVGTWKYTNGSTSITVTLQKKIMQQNDNINNNTYFFEDIIIGEYKYIENGVEKINTLPQLSLSLTPFEYSIAGNLLYGAVAGNRKLRAEFSQQNRYIPCMGQAMFMERADSGGVQKLKLNFKMTDGPCVDINEPLQYTGYTVPFGTYILIKQ